VTPAPTERRPTLATILATIRSAATRIALASVLAAVSPVLAQQGRDPSDAFFKKGEIPAIRLEFPPESADALRREPRAYVRCTLVVDGKPHSTNAGAKIKGSAGSTQSFDERPAFTVDVDRFGEAPLLFGLEKFHLNNSVQDPSLLSEWTCAEILREAGYPHVRSTHARFTLDARDMGVYVLKESFDEHFLGRAFKDPSGNLYDGGFCQDIDAGLELDEGDGPADRPDLRALADACRDPDMKRRWAAIERIVDIEEFVRFMALEGMLGHWDGYSYNTNNYRLYFDPRGKARFLLHGMDQCFGDPGASVLDMPRGMLAASVMKNPDWRKAYRREVTRLLPEFAAKRLVPRLEVVERRVQAALRATDPAAADEQAARAREFVDRLVAREAALREQSRAPEPKPLEFKPGRERQIAGWHPMSEVEDATVEEAKGRDARWLRVACGPSGRCIAGFRRGLLLPRGRYRFEAVVRTADVAPIAGEEQPVRGAGIRVSGGVCPSPLEGTGASTIAVEFEVSEETADVELVVELRASKGEAVFRADSLVLRMLPPPKRGE